VFSHLLNLELDLTTVRCAIDGASEVFARKLVLRLVKRVLRAGLELVANREQEYTRDPRMCCELFGQYYPDLVCFCMAEALSCLGFRIPSMHLNQLNQ
jgi:hypothetical protein